MKTNTFRFLICLCLTASLLSSFLIPVLAETSEKEKTLYIGDEDRFLRFAENCRMDSYSRDLTVTLGRDLDLTGVDFPGIPLFLGIFEGNHHKISGISLTADGSNLGLFRFLEEGSLVKNLTVSGVVTPEGSRLNLGGIAGTNRGTIKNCRFDGTVSGADRIGGIAGVNTLTGIIENCRILGSVSGDHFIGGAAGENNGVIRDCVNCARINTEARENTVNVKSISIETITGTESPSTVTDAGGIAGTSVGVIRNCINRGDVGYLHMGYNIGGIAGSQIGYIDSCQNYGTIYGRKEVGGIAGQFEPISRIEYQIDTLEILEEQLSAASSLLNRAAYNAQSSMGAVESGITDMIYDSQDARDALHQLNPQNHPDKDTLIAAHNTVKSCIQDMYDTLEEVGEEAGSAAGQLSSDLRAVSAQMGAMGRTIREANEHMGITLTDVSDLDTEEDSSGKISNSRNNASVSGDLNTGGIAGSIAYEKDLDPEEDLKISGDRSMNVTGSLRAVILGCENQGTVSAKKLHAGGIIGFMSMGLVKNCVNTGILNAEKAQYVGGIAGNSRGYIRNCSVKCELSGSTCIGGIAGSGTIATDCLSMVNIRKGSEKLGAILGIQEASQSEEITVPVADNLYMSLGTDPGAIDGLSFEGLAEPMAPDKFQNLPNLPETFRQAKLLFLKEDGSQEKRLELPIGDLFHPKDVPEVPEKQGCMGVWEGLDNYIGQRVYFDLVFSPLYTPHRITISSPQARENGRPVLLAEGVFPEIQEIHLEEQTIPKISNTEVLEAWTLPQFSMDKNTELHFCQPENTDIQQLKILVCREGGVWEETEASISGRHLIFSVKPGDQAFCVAVMPDYSETVYVIGGLVLVLLLILIKYIRSCRKGRTVRKGVSAK